MKIYVVSKQYQPLITINENQDVSKISISIHELNAIFNNSKSQQLYACKRENDALAIAACLTKTRNNTNANPDVQAIASLVVFTVEIDKVLEQTLITTLTTPEKLKTYTIHNSDLEQYPHQDIQTALYHYERSIYFFEISGAKLAMPTEAHYVNTSLDSFTKVSFSDPYTASIMFNSTKKQITPNPTVTSRTNNNI